MASCLGIVNGTPARVVAMIWVATLRKEAPAELHVATPSSPVQQREAMGPLHLVPTSPINLLHHIEIGCR
jgi:hypothetical protein